MTRTLFVDKTSQTMADALVAHGLAFLVREVLERTSPRRERPIVLLRDGGSTYRIESSAPLSDARLDAVPPLTLEAPIIVTLKNRASLPSDLPPNLIVSYEEERDRRAAYFEARNNLPIEALTALRQGREHPALEALRANTPHEHWDIFRAINPAALTGYNKLLVQWWTVREALPDVLKLLRDLFAQSPNDVAEAAARWVHLDKEKGWGIGYRTTALQIFNPAQGKGQNRPKADTLRMDNIKDAFWLLEWLKAIGFYQSALTKQLRGTKDRKTYVLAPQELDLRVHRPVMAAFRSAMNRAETSVRADILVALRYTQELLRYSQSGQDHDLRALLVRVGAPARVVPGFRAAFYKDLGNSAATMNLAFIGLPEWLRLHNEQSVAAALSVLEEHESIVRQFDESHSDEITLLLRYRDFISASHLEPFLEFTTAYAGYIVGQRERSGGRARQLTIDNLRRLIVNVEPRLSRILDSVGFRNIAYAIRQSTVTAQYRRKQLNDRRYDVRYGLNLELARKANYAGDFVTALSEFLHKYNAENAQVMETRPGPYRASIKTSDIEEIVALVDEYGAPLVCNLLIAYGYARTPRDASAQPDEELDDQADVISDLDDEEPVDTDEE